MNVELSLAPRVSIKKKKHRCCWKRYIRKSKTTLHYRKCQEIMQNEKNVKAYQACLGISLADFKSYLTSRTTCHGARDRLENPPGELCSNPNFPNTLTQREKLVIINSKKGREREREMEGSDSLTLEASIIAKPLLWRRFMQTHKVDNETNNNKWERMLRRSDHQIASGMKNGKGRRNGCTTKAAPQCAIDNLLVENAAQTHNFQHTWMQWGRTKEQEII